MFPIMHIDWLTPALFPFGNLSASIGRLFLIGNITSVEQFGNSLRERRRALGLTQDEVALQAGVGRRYYLELEAGKPGASLGPALRCAQILGLDLSLHPRGDG